MLVGAYASILFSSVVIEKEARFIALRNLFAIVSSILQHYHISEIFQRATKRGKFSRAAWEFDVVLNLRQ